MASGGPTLVQMQIVTSGHLFNFLTKVMHCSRSKAVFSIYSAFNFCQNLEKVTVIFASGADAPDI